MAHTGESRRNYGAPWSTFQTRYQNPSPTRSNASTESYSSHSSLGSPDRSPRRSRNLVAGEATTGMVAWLQHKTPALAATSIAYDGKSQRHLNDGAFEHPAMIVDIIDEIALCLPMTSFGNQGIAGKFKYGSAKKIKDARAFYLAINHQNGTIGHDGTPVLRLQGDINMGLQSYVHLDQFFHIEIKNLRACKARTVLEEASLDALMQEFGKFLRGEMGITVNSEPKANAPTSPLVLYGVPELSEDAARRCAPTVLQKASLDRADRHVSQGWTEVTGWPVYQYQQETAYYAVAPVVPTLFDSDGMPVYQYPYMAQPYMYGMSIQPIAQCAYGTGWQY